jgi:hypothetical protein
MIGKEDSGRALSGRNNASSTLGAISTPTQFQSCSYSFFFLVEGGSVFLVEGGEAHFGRLSSLANEGPAFEENLKVIKAATVY